MRVGNLDYLHVNAERILRFTLRINYARIDHYIDRVTHRVLRHAVIQTERTLVQYKLLTYRKRRTVVRRPCGIAGSRAFFRGTGDALATRPTGGVFIDSRFGGVNEGEGTGERRLRWRLNDFVSVRGHDEWTGVTRWSRISRRGYPYARMGFHERTAKGTERRVVYASIPYPRERYAVQREEDVDQYSRVCEDKVAAHD